jgi:hypothetical protein
MFVLAVSGSHLELSSANLKLCRREPSIVLSFREVKDEAEEYHRVEDNERKKCRNEGGVVELRRRLQVGAEG